MKLGKGIVICMVVLFLGLLIQFFIPKKQATSQIAYQTPHKGIITNRADDPTYAEEVKGFSAILEAEKEEFEKQRTNLEQKTSQMLSDLDKKTADLQREAENRVTQYKRENEALKKMLEEQKQPSGNVGASGVPVIDVTPDSKGGLLDQGKGLIGQLNPFQKSGANDSSAGISSSTTRRTNDGRVLIYPYGTTPPPTGSSPFGAVNVSNPFKKVAPAAGKNDKKNNTSNAGASFGLNFQRSKTDNPFATTVGIGGQKLQPIPIYTIPDTATLVTNAGMTPFIGKVPNSSSSVPDPYRFKLITGKENLATNGLRIPGIESIIWTGWAVGVREQSCVRGYIDTITYTFQDGRIQTISTGKSKNAKAGDNLGYITDRWGKPCIRGKYINNASDYLKDRSIAAFLAAMADAAADAEVTINDSDGGIKQYISGDSMEYALMKGLSGTGKEIANYVRERAANAFDVVYAPSGSEVQIFIEQEIPIDYDPNGRKLGYDYSTKGFSSGKLD